MVVFGLTVAALCFGFLVCINLRDLVVRSHAAMQQNHTVYDANWKPEIPSDHRVSVTQYGARGDGVTDDTAAIQSAIAAVHAVGGGIVYVPDGTYTINAKNSIQMLSNTELLMAPNAVLLALPNNLETSAVIRIANVHDVEISGGMIKGDRNSHQGNTGEWGMGVHAEASTNVVLQDLTVTNCWGDGVYLGVGDGGYVQNGLLKNLKLVQNRRNGISLVSGRNIAIEDCTASWSGGTDPGDGVDVEPNHPSNVLSAIEISNLKTAYNAGSGLSIGLTNLNNSWRTVSVTVTGHHDVGSSIGLSISKPSAIGYVRVTQSNWIKEKSKTYVIWDNSPSYDEWRVFDHLNISVNGVGH